MAFEDPRKEGTESLTWDDALNDPEIKKILEEESLKYLRNNDSDYFFSHFSGELDEEGYLYNKNREQSNTTPSMNIGGGKAMEKVLNAVRGRLPVEAPEEDGDGPPKSPEPPEEESQEASVGEGFGNRNFYETKESTGERVRGIPEDKDMVDKKESIPETEEVEEKEAEVSKGEQIEKKTSITGFSEGVGFTEEELEGLIVDGHSLADIKKILLDKVPVPEDTEEYKMRLSEASGIISDRYYLDQPGRGAEGFFKEFEKQGKSLKRQEYIQELRRVAQKLLEFGVPEEEIKAMTPQVAKDRLKELEGGAEETPQEETLQEKPRPSDILSGKYSGGSPDKKESVREESGPEGDLSEESQGVKVGAKVRRIDEPEGEWMEVVGIEQGVEADDTEPWARLVNGSFYRFSELEVKKERRESESQEYEVQDVTDSESMEDESLRVSEENESSEGFQEEDSKEKGVFSEKSEREKSEKFEKRWNEMSDEERQEKYGKTFELREKIIALREARNRVAVVHERRRGFLGKRHEKAYQAVLGDYEEKRAEYVGAKAWRVLKEKKSLAEKKAEVHSGGKFEKVRKAWRWLGEQNIDKLLSSKDYEIKSRPLKFMAKMASLRTATNLALLGVGGWAGAGIASLGALSARRVFSGTATGMAVYDLMRNISDNKELSLNQGEIENMTLDDLAEKLSAYEARARLSGKRVVEGDEYSSLRKSFYEKLKEESNVEGFDMSVFKDMTWNKLMSKSDDLLSSKEAEVAQGDKRKKMAATAVGLFVGSGMLGKLFSGQKDVAGTVPEEGSDAFKGSKIFEADLVPEPKGGFDFDPFREATEAGFKPDIPNEVIERAQSGSEIVMEKSGVFKADLVPEPKGGFDFDPFREGVEPGFSPDFSEQLSIVAENAPEKIEGLASTIKEGGSLWQAGKELIKSGEISKEQFAEAWSSAESVVKLASGETVHISEAGLTHAGDQIVYVAGTDSAEAHFVVIDYVKDGLYIGSNEDLAEALVSQGKEVPGWMSGVAEEVGVGDETSEVVSKIIEGEAVDVMTREEFFDWVGNFNKELGQKLAEEPEMAERVIKKAVEENESVVREAVSGSLDVVDGVEITNGTAEFVTNESGQIREVVFKEVFTPGQREAFVNEAVGKILKPNYKNYIQEDITSMYNITSFAGIGEVIPQKIARAKEAAFEIFRLQEVMSKLEPKSREWHFVLGEIKKIITPVNWLDGKTVIVDGHFLNIEMFKNIKLPE